MSKRFNSLLFSALAVVLLAAPAQAQTYAKKAVNGKGTVKMATLLPQLNIGDAVKKTAEERTVQEDRVTKESDQSVVRTAQGRQAELKLVSRAYYMNRIFGNNRETAPVQQNVPYYAAAPTTNSYGIITSPDAGEHKFYQRGGTSYYPNNNQIYATAQNGHVEIVEAADGVVYIKDPVSLYTQNTWVKGTKSGNTITVPTGQPLAYNTQYAATLSLNWGNYDENTEAGWNKVAAENITFTIDGDVITLEGSNEDLYIGIFWDDDNSFGGYGDYETVWTYDAEYAPVSTELITLPAGVTAETWYRKGNFANSQGTTPFNATAQVAFDGNDVYVSGIFNNYPSSWIKGTISGTTATFSGLQFLGAYGSYNIFATGTDGNSLVDFTMTYDAEAQTLVADNFLLANAADNRVYYLEWIESITLSKNPFEAPEEPTIVVGAPVDNLPYINPFETEEQIGAFGIYDANNDGKTWGPYNGAIRYMYDSNNNADDWFVSPGIKMEAGKNYTFSLDIWSAATSYPERIEVLYGKEPKASAMVNTVIPTTTINWTSAKTFEIEGINVEETGYYYFGIHAISDADEYALYIDNFNLALGAEATAPSAITDLAVESLQGSEVGATVTFTAPSTAINGSPLTGNIAKIELYRDAALIHTFTNVALGQKITYVDQDENLTQGKHVYQVIPYDQNGPGQKSEEVAATLVTVLNVPTTIDFTQASTFDICQVIDANGDGSTWGWSSYNFAYCMYNSNNDCDDYLVTQPIQLTKGKNYSVIVDLAAYNASYPERFEVKVGKVASVEGLNTTVIPATDLTTTEYTEFDGEFTAPEDGTYFVAVHAISDAYMYYVRVRSITIEAGLLPTSPKAPRLAVQPDPYGAEKAVVTVTAPGRSYDGSKLTAKLSHLDILRNGVVIKSYEDVAPEAIKVFVDEDVTSGTYTYQAIPYDENGERGQKSPIVEKFIGVDALAAVTNIHPTGTTANTITLAWDPVVGQNGGYVDAASIEYNVYTLHVESNGYYNYLVVDDLVASVTGETQATFDFPVDEGNQEYQYFGVSAKSLDSETDATAAYTYALVGAPFDLPFEENFAGSSFHTVWTNSEATGLYSSNNASDEDGVALMLVSVAEGDVILGTGKLNLNSATNPTLLFDARTESADAKLSIIGSKNGGSDVLVKDNVPLSAEFNTVKVNLNNLKGGRYANVAFKAVLPELSTVSQYYQYWGDSIILDNIRIVDLLEYNLAVSVSAPKTLQAGDKANVLVTVQNIGENAAKDFTVTLLAGEQELLKQTVSEPLASFQKKEFTAEVATTIFDDVADLTISAVVDYDLDLDLDDNEAETIIAIKQSSAAAPENVVGVKTDKGVKLTWNAPSSTTEEVTDDVEGYDNDDNGGLDADVHLGKIGEWTVYDGNNGLYGYGFNGIETQMGLPGSFMVFNPSSIDAGLAESYPAHSGDKYFLSAACAQPDGNIEDTDNWLISPALPGIAQTISFWVRELVTDYGPEKYEVLYSTTDNQIESFSLLAAKTAANVDWQEVSFDLPAGTTYFAIRHTSNDVWGLMIDDITYTRGGGSIASYNVWVDGELAESTTATSIELEGATTSQVFAVSAVYQNGSESRPVVFIFNEADKQLTGINAIMASGKPVDIYSVDGKLVRSQATDVRGLKGAYIIDGQKVIVK